MVAMTTTQRFAPTSARAPMARPSWMQAVLLLAGAIMLPAGLIIIEVGWWGAAHSPYSYDQLSYLISGGLFGLGLAFVGGFLYFGSWLAKISADNSEAMARLADSLQEMGQSLSHAQPSLPANPTSSVPALTAGANERPVTTANGTLMHLPNCSLVVGRDDLHPADPDADLKPCKLCLGLRPVPAVSSGDADTLVQ